ncbi:hypothetical protein FRC12_023305 [Ceratobasidium sp. 428]|nr:hypothetical protein FRC12_023305 [Ceratobasidium sp. 428]
MTRPRPDLAQDLKSDHGPTLIHAPPNNTASSTYIHCVAPGLLLASPFSSCLLLFLTLLVSTTTTTTTTLVRTRIDQSVESNAEPQIHASLAHHIVQEMNTNTLSTPSPVESAFYYYGLPSKPALVARSSIELWEEPRGPEAYLVAKELKPVGPHDLNRVWESVVASAMVAYLEKQQVAWTSLDPVRIGYAGGEYFPVIIWVGVIPRSLPGEQGVEVALGCRTILMDNGVFDVHVEIRSSKTALQAKLYESVEMDNAVAQAIEPFTATLGLPICGAETPNIEGTGGFFFTDSTRPDKLFLVTARHVFFHPDFTTNEDYRLDSTSKAAKKVLLFGNAALELRTEAIRSEVSSKDHLLTHLAAKKKAIKGQDDKSAERRAKVESQEKDARNAITDLNNLLDDIARDWASPADRTIGHIVFSPRFDFGVEPGRYTEDWAVVEIDRSRIDNTNFIGNCIDLETSVSAESFTSWMCPRSADPPSFEYPGDRLLKFSGTIPDSEMDKPDEKTLDHNNEPVIMVIKRGGASGLTVGRLNSICSVVRYYFKDQPSQSTREVAVYPRNSSSGPFSQSGDSGSVVIDGKGRVAGILTGGAGATELSDCTYVTSINFLIKRLENFGYKPNIFPTVDNLQALNTSLSPVQPGGISDLVTVT